MIYTEDLDDTMINVNEDINDLSHNNEIFDDNSF